jgi:hypothetical protein
VVFDITPEDIQNLSDGDLRELVARLCEAELHQRGLSTVAVRYGGNQDAKDGGIDVWVELAAGAVIDGYIPRRTTIYQVKKPSMPASKIAKEMSPKGKLRPAIAELAGVYGAYVIVSSGTSIAELKKHTDAMRRELSKTPGTEAIHVDFYDRQTLTNWVRSHAGMIAWVRLRAGRPLTGWRAFGKWATSTEEAEGSYILDDEIRMSFLSSSGELKLKPLEGLNHLRNRLSNAQSILRLLGLSGVGKTRLLQALFDKSVGEGSLERTSAIYGDFGDELEPSPLALASQLIGEKKRAVMLIDNCDSDLHRRLTEQCRSSDSRISLVTVEYDIRDDQPEGTEVVKLEAASPELIQKLVLRRFPNLSEVDAGTIAEFSEGNSKIAIAIAGTVGLKETFTGISDNGLFERLFRMGQQVDTSLERIAEACALAYSFQGEKLDESGELVRIAAVAGCRPGDVHAAVAELERRGLAQRRDVWRAVLPQAIADRLAASGLHRFPMATIKEELVDKAPDRLFRSFSRRIGFLHKSDHAVTIAKGWLSPGGLLGNVARLDELYSAVLHNVAPACPNDALAAIERAIPTILDEDALEYWLGHVGLLHSMAYEPKFFDRSMTILAKIALARDVRSKSNRAAERFASLFWPRLSGTRAPIQQRLKLVESMICSTEENRKQLGILSLSGVLNAEYYNAHHAYSFGAWSRDYGYQPRGMTEVHEWFGSAFALCRGVAETSANLRRAVQTALVPTFAGLWMNVSFLNSDLDSLCRSVAGSEFWIEGWHAVRGSFRYRGEEPLPDEELLKELEAFLRPSLLVEKVRGLIIAGHSSPELFSDYLTASELNDSTNRRDFDVSEALGEAVGLDDQAFSALCKELVTSDQGIYLFPFGRGLAKTYPDLRGLWARLRTAISAVAGMPVYVGVLRGILAGIEIRDRDLVEALLDDAVEDPILAEWYPVLQMAIVLDDCRCLRLRRSIDCGRADVRRYRGLTLGNITGGVSGESLAQIFAGLARLPHGSPVAIQELVWHFHNEDRAQRQQHPEILSVGKGLLQRADPCERYDHSDYNLSKLAGICLAGEDGQLIAKELCGKILGGLRNYKTYVNLQTHLLESLFRVQPLIMLDEFFMACSEVEHPISDFGWQPTLSNRNPINYAADRLLDWCDRDPEPRYPWAARVISPIHFDAVAGREAWLPVVLEMLNRSADRASVTSELLGHLRRAIFRALDGSSGRVQMQLLETLKSSIHMDVRTVALEGEPGLVELIEKENLASMASNQGFRAQFEAD